MASIMRSIVASALFAAVAVSSVGVALAKRGGNRAPAPVSAAAELLPASVVASLIVAVSSFFAARSLKG